MKIVHVLAYYGNYYGGIQHTVREISRRQRSLGHEVSILTSDRFSAGNLIEGVPVRRLKTPFTAFRVPFIPRLLPALLTEDCDVLSVFLPFPSLDVFAAMRKMLRPRTKLVVSIRNLLPNAENLADLIATNIHNKFTIKMAIDSCDALLFTTKEFPRSLPYEIPEEKMFIIPNGIDIDTFQPRPDYSFNRNQILHVGRLIPEKGLEILVRAVRIVREDFPEMKLVAVGSDYYGQQGYKQKVMALGDGFLDLRSNVSNAELARLYRESAVFVLPSIGLESFGNVLIEAMASGSPVICTDLPGPKDLVTSGRAVPVGTVVKKGGVEELSEAIIHELHNNKKERRKKIREFAASKASWDSVTRRLIEVYEKCKA